MVAVLGGLTTSPQLTVLGSGRAHNAATISGRQHSDAKSASSGHLLRAGEKL
jgi:hypothetical protein